VSSSSTSPHGPWRYPVNFIFGGGILGNDDTGAIQVIDHELRALEFLLLSQPLTPLARSIYGGLATIDQRPSGLAD
jgi:hypothetical protein